MANIIEQKRKINHRAKSKFCLGQSLGSLVHLIHHRHKNGVVGSSANKQNERTVQPKKGLAVKQRKGFFAADDWLALFVALAT
jgi:hypothetical protein